MDIFEFFTNLFKMNKSPFRPFSFLENSINQPRGHANTVHTKKPRPDRRVKPVKCRLSRMQRRAVIRRGR